MIGKLLRIMKKTIKSLSVKLALSALSLVGALGLLASGTVSVNAQVSTTNIFMSNTRYSFVGKLTTGNVVDSSLALIRTTQDALDGVYSTSSTQLQASDPLRIGSNIYYVASTSAITPENQVPLDRPLLSADIADGTSVIMKSQGTINVGIKTTVAGTDGALQVLVPAFDGTMLSDDGIPDPGFFDYNVLPTVTCPTNAGGASFLAPIATPSASVAMISGTPFHSFLCPYTGTLAVGTDFGFETNDNFISISGLINPAPREDHEIGMVDLTTFMVREMGSGNTVLKTNYVAAGVVEAVKAIVSVAPQITFEVNGVGANLNRCDNQITTDVSTTGIEVPFGDITPMMFRNAAQQLSVSTNAANGYVVTVATGDQMSLDGDGCPGTNTGAEVQTCINDFLGSNTASGTDEVALDTAIPWNDINIKGFGYTIGTPSTTSGAYIDANGVAHEVSTVGDWSVADGFKKFADQSATGGTASDLAEYPRIVIQNSSSTNEDVVDFCYRIVPSSNLVSGDYSTNVLFTATATF